MSWNIETRKAQVTIFIILAIVLVVGIILAFILIGGNSGDSEVSAIENPKKFIVDCVEEIVLESKTVLMENGGRIEPVHYINYSGDKYNYLCHNGDYYLPCYNTHPMLEEIVEVEMRDDTIKKVQECFDELEEDLSSKGYTFSSMAGTYSIDLLHGVIEVNLMQEVRIEKDDSSQNFDDFSFKIPSEFYGLVSVAREIVNSESQYCNVDYNGYMILYPEFDIRRNDVDGSKIYNVIYRDSQENFRFAVRSCAFAPGI